VIHRSMDTRTSLPAVAVKRQKGHAGLMGNDLVVEAKGLRKSYGAVAAVDGLDLEMARGEVLSLLGPNGAGKTTTVEILEGYRRRDNGEVRVLGEDPQRAGTEWRARRGIVLQNNEDVADLSVSESVRHFARFYPRLLTSRRDRAGRPLGQARCPDKDALWRTAPAPRCGARHNRRSRTAVLGRTDHRL